MFAAVSAFNLEKWDAPLPRGLQWRALRGREKWEVGGRDAASKQSYCLLLWSSLDPPPLHTPPTPVSL